MKLVSFFLSSLLTAAVLSSSVSADEVKKNCKVKNKHSPKHHQKHHHQKQHHKHHHHHHHKNNSTPSYSGNKNHNLTPGGCKAGVAGEQSVALLASGISWINNWQGTPFDKLPKDITFVSQCYGYGWSGHPEDWQRFEEFKKIQPGTYGYVMAGNEIDFKGHASAGLIPPKDAAKLWEQWIKPHADAGAVTITPSCAKQLDEDWMGPFLDAVTTKPDIVNVHLFSDKVEDITKVIEHYAKFNKPMWVTEFACINFKINKFCSQQETNDFIWNAVRIFEADDRIKAYSYADADNGSNCKLSQSGKLTESGQAYLGAIQKYGNKKDGNKMKRAIQANQVVEQDDLII